MDYRPPFSTLGLGTDAVTAEYRQSDNRAHCPAVCQVHHADGVATVEGDCGGVNAIEDDR